MFGLVCVKNMGPSFGGSVGGGVGGALYFAGCGCFLLVLFLLLSSFNRSIVWSFNHRWLTKSDSAGGARASLLCEAACEFVIFFLVHAVFLSMLSQGLFKGRLQCVSYDRLDERGALCGIQRRILERTRWGGTGGGGYRQLVLLPFFYWFLDLFLYGCVAASRCSHVPFFSFFFLVKSNLCGFLRFRWRVCLIFYLIF